MTRNIGRNWLGLVALAAIVAGGCPKASVPPAAGPQASDSEVIAPVAAASGEAAVEEGSHSPAFPITDQAAKEVKPIASSEEPARPESKERILLLAPGRPLIIDFVLTIDGRPHTEALSRLVEEVLKIADTDGDGRTMWKELCASERIKYGQFGNLPIDGDNSEKQTIERYDIARDGVVDRSELPRFLTRNAGGSRPFSIRGTFDHRGSNRNRVATWQMIDTDGDGRIDASERKAAPARLATKDDDDDEIVSAAELNPRVQAPEAEATMTDRRRRGPDAARLLGEHADWISVQRTVEQEYAGGGTLKADNLEFSPELFRRLDANHDGRIGRDEFKRLNDIPADVVVEVAFGSGGMPALDEEQPRSTAAKGKNRSAEHPLKLRYAVFDLPARGKLFLKQLNRLPLVFDSLSLTFATNDTVATADFAAQAKQALDMFDQNKDGYLERNEVPESLQGQLSRFEALDADGDGKAYPHEIEAFITQRQAGLRAQIHVRVSDAEDLLFVALDTSQDQRLDSREIQQAGERLAELDANHDGELMPDELPESITIVLARGSLESAEATFSLPPAVEGEKQKAPTWFTAMDANQDGVISRREFLGTAEQFERLDRDTSGLLELAEIESAQ
jgi:Ca2+-binding EF-hand superfamily protein